MKHKNKITLFVLMLIEFFFFYRNSFQMSEIFFFTWFAIFGTFFAFRFIGVGSSFGGMGANAKFMSAKYIESMSGIGKQNSTRNNDFALDLIFVLLAISNFILSIISYYVGR